MNSRSQQPGGLMDASLTFTVEDLHCIQQFPLILERPRFHLPYSWGFLLHLHVYCRPALLHRVGKESCLALENKWFWWVLVYSPANLFHLAQRKLKQHFQKPFYLPIHIPRQEKAQHITICFARPPSHTWGFAEEQKGNGEGSCPPACFWHLWSGRASPSRGKGKSHLSARDWTQSSGRSLEKKMRFFFSSLTWTSPQLARQCAELAEEEQEGLWPGATPARRAFHRSWTSLLRAAGSTARGSSW